MIVHFELNDKEKEFLIEISKIGNRYCGRREDDSFLDKYRNEFNDMKNIFFNWNESSYYWQYELNEDGLKIQKLLL